SVTVKVHQLWSRTGASPHARHLDVAALGLEPLAGGVLAVAQVRVELDFAIPELADEQVLLAVAVDVGPTGGRITGAVHAHRLAVGEPANRPLEFSPAAHGAGTKQTDSRVDHFHRWPPFPKKRN